MDGKIIHLASFVVENELLRLDEFLRMKLHLSPKHVGRCLQNGWISVNRLVRTHKSALLNTGDLVSTIATPFQISQARFATPLLPILFRTAAYKILWKPAGMPVSGNDSETVENALPASMDDERYVVMDCVGRIISGPVLVSLDAHVSQQQGLVSLQEVSKRYTFQLIVHGSPPDCLNMVGFIWLRRLRTTVTTSGTLSTIHVMLSHSGRGLRGCLLKHKTPILGTSARIKSNANGCFATCIKLELLWNQPNATVVVTMDVPDKFHSVLEREQRFYNRKQQRETDQDVQNKELRRKYMDQMVGINTEELMSNRWSVTSFCGLSFFVTSDVMSPKPSSEVLIQSAKEYLSNSENASVLDLGTGTGCLLIASLMAAGETTRGVGVDISTEALRVAEINIQSHGLSNRAHLALGDFSDLSFLGKKVFDVILCNPPYLTNGECIKDGLLGPRIALVAGNRGLGCYEMVAEQVEPFLKPQGVMIVEVGGKRHVDEIRAIFKNLEYVGLRFDLQGRGRCLILKKCATNL